MPAPTSADLIALLRARGQTVATAESLTGGLVAAALTDPAGASAAFLGGIVAYSHEAKAELLGVAPELLAAAGAVDPRVAQAMATGARDRLGATWGLATTGVAGPEPSDGKAVGTIFVAVAGPHSAVRELTLAGDRPSIRAQTCENLFEIFQECLECAHVTGC